MKRYLIFVYDSHYPSGGWGDLHAQADSLDYAKSIAREQDTKGLNVHVVDTQTGDGEEVDWRT